jgi:hypothetical protein
MKFASRLNWRWATKRFFFSFECSRFRCFINFRGDNILRTHATRQRYFEQRWRRSKLAREFVARRYKTQNQFVLINHRHFIDRFTTFLQSCTQHWDVRNDCTRHDSRRKRTWEKSSRSKIWYISDSTSISNSCRERSWEISTIWTIKLDNVEMNRRRISHRRHHESFKKDFFEQTKIDKDSSRMRRRSEREIWSKTKKKKTSFKLKILLHHLCFLHDSLVTSPSRVRVRHI